MAVDSTFALAGLGHAIATSWNFATAAPSQGTAIAFRHRDKLGPRDLVLLEMWSPQLFAERPVSGRERIEVRERLAARIPDRPEAWYLIGDAYYHTGAASGYEVREALRRADNAFRRALALDPDITYLRRHVVDIAWAGDDPFERVPKLIDSMKLESPDYQLAAAIIMGDSAQVKRLISNLPNLDVNGVMISGFVATALGLPDMGDSAFALADARSTNVADRRGIYRARRTLLLGQGRPVAAAGMTEALDRLSDEPGRTPFALDVVLAAVFANGDTVAAARAARQFRQRMNPAPGVTAANRRDAAWAAGLWASYVSDTSTLAQAIAVLDTLALTPAAPVSGSLSELRANGLRLVSPNATPDRRMLERVDSVLATGPALVGDARAAMNLIVARSFEKLGDARGAQRAANRVPPGEVLYVMGAPAALDQARLNLAAGDTTLAITIYRWYLLGRRAAEPPQKQADEAIQKKLDELLRRRR